MNRFFQFILIFLPVSQCLSQVSIEGIAPDYQGQTVTLSTYRDLFTFETKEVASTKVDSQGNFRISLPQVEKGLFAFAFDRNVFAHVFLENKQEYTIHFPKPEKLHPGLAQDIFVEPEMVSPTISLHHSIGELESAIDDFVRENAFFFENPKKLKPLADSAMQAWKDSFALNTDPYFHEYLWYRMAEFEIITYHSKKEVLKKYFANNRPAYHQLSFARAFKQLFPSYLRPHSTRKNSEAVSRAIRKRNLALLDSLLASDPLLENPAIRELLIITELYELGAKRVYPKNAVLPMLDQIRHNSHIPEHINLADAAYNRINYLSPGTPAPDFTFTDHMGNSQNLGRLSGALVYLNFIQDWDLKTSEDISLMKVLKKGYGQDIAFVTIYMGNNPRQLKARMKDFKIDWVLGVPENIAEVVDLYQLRAFPSYFYIGKDGNFILSPAPSPGANIEREFAKEYHRTHAEQNKLFKLQPPQVEEPEK